MFNAYSGFIDTNEAFAYHVEEQIKKGNNYFHYKSS